VINTMSMDLTRDRDLRDLVRHMLEDIFEVSYEHYDGPFFRIKGDHDPGRAQAAIKVLATLFAGRGLKYHYSCAPEVTSVHVYGEAGEERLWVLHLVEPIYQVRRWGYWTRPSNDVLTLPEARAEARELGDAIYESTDCGATWRAFDTAPAAREVA
jgi:hypothetical protein